MDLYEDTEDDNIIYYVDVYKMLPALEDTIKLKFDKDEF